MSASELLHLVERSGGRLYLKANRRLHYERVHPKLVSHVRYRAKELAVLLAEREPALQSHLAICPTFPHCAACGSHALYRKPDGEVECLTCGPYASEWVQ